MGDGGVLQCRVNLRPTDIGGCQVTHPHGLGIPVKETEMFPGLSNVTNAKPAEVDGSFSFTFINCISTLTSNLL